MKLLIIGLSLADPDVIFAEQQLQSIQTLVTYGSYGTFEILDRKLGNRIWLALAAGLSPESVDEIADDRKLLERSMWREVARQGRSALALDVLPGYFHPENIQLQEQTVNPAANDFEGSLGLGEENHGIHFDKVRQLLGTYPWDFLQFVDRSILSSVSDRDRESNELLELQRAAAEELEAQLASILAMLDDETVVLLCALNEAAQSGESAGRFVLASSNNPIGSELSGVRLSDIAPTLLTLAGLEVPSEMEGESLVTKDEIKSALDGSLTEDEEAQLRERLSGLGYF